MKIYYYYIYIFNKEMAEVQTKRKEKFENKMRDIRIEKLVLNCSVGESGDRLTKAAKVLEDLTD